MNQAELYRLIKLPDAVVIKLNEYEKTRSFILGPDLKNRLLQRKSWEEAVKELCALLGEDKDGMKALYEMLILSLETYEKYEAAGISKEIFIETMKFCTRFLNEYKNTYGEYRFIWAWWFPRQLSFLEFRVGCLEYEFIDGEEKVVSVHIPSDAVFTPQSVDESLKRFSEFCGKYFPEYKNARMICESWMLSPALFELLEEKSNVLSFNKRFEIESVDYENKGVLDWVFPGYKEISKELPENTSLQRKMKAYLLGGKKVGWAKGYMK